ncbi:precorrin-6y C5,15-methyltransferase (decarboxylating) subunit CbiE [Acetobacter okinawensis]|uniref:Precorrin-6Y C5,15-methyltransferase n=1 Tax=Acetobacter okinawensis TaxID=1076594 RepID=A0A252BUV5_9PROT|nr:precorrin-6y C5,15-methyltransferase (decarboxylating) subunit CbiE [Acetobacter okinawensis]OUJ12738.1 precorrin-6Y C5,15-methyltransferase [Acetobacter okinawensis]
MPERNMHNPAPWLSVIGVGEDGLSGLSGTARDLIAQAEYVFGGTRHLALVATLPQGICTAWPTPFSEGVRQVLALRGRQVVVLASGDPFFYGVGGVLARSLGVGEMLCLPGVSSVALACARLGWAREQCHVVSVCGRPVERVRPFLQPQARLLVLSADATSPRLLAEWLVGLGLGAVRCHVLEALGGANERCRSFVAEDGPPPDVGALNLLALEVPANLSALCLPRCAGLPDSCFEHDGQLTRQDIRAVTLSALAPRTGELLWDIGGGAGSVSIEWMLAAPECRAITIESVAERAARIMRNAQALGVPDLLVVQARAPQGLDGLDMPDAIFVGGGASRPGVLEQAWAALRPGGRMVVNAVVVETENRLLQAVREWGGRLTRLSIARLDAVGGFHAFRPAMTVTQWVASKPDKA